jgi:hypothetical protein
MHSHEQLAKADIERLFVALNAELARVKIVGEVYIVGGAVMCVAFDARESTGDVDAVFKPASAVRIAAAKVAARAGVAENWLNDAAKGWASPHGSFDSWLDLPHLKVFTAQAAYVLAMKCVAMRIGPEFHDVDDVRYLIRHLNLSTADEVLALVAEYFDADSIPAKTRFAVEELLGG